MKWTLQVLYSQILLIVLCLSFPSPDIQAAGTDRRSRDTYQTKTSSPDFDSLKIPFFLTF